MKKVFLSLVFILGVFFVSAQTPEQFTGSLLWKVSGNGLKSPSYVFGTYHLYGAELLDSVPGLKQAIEATTQVVAEVDPKEMAGMQMQIMAMAMLSEDESYKNLLSSEEYTRLDNALKANIGAGLEQIGTMKPGFVGVSLAGLLHLKLNPDFNPMAFEGIDQYLTRTATEAGKPVLGLESADSQIQLLFNSEPQKTQMLSLLCSLENMDYQLEGLRSMSASYKKGNIYELYRNSFHDDADPCIEFNTEEHKNALLKNRNDHWMTQLPAILKEASTLVVVGALHLPAEEGVLYQLAKLGYKVEAVK